MAQRVSRITVMMTDADRSRLEREAQAEMIPASTWANRVLVLELNRRQASVAAIGGLAK